MTAAHYAGISRVPLAIAAAAFLLHAPVHGPSVAAGLTVAAGITDVLDGALARRFRTTSAFGAVLDLTADKVFVVPILFLAAHANLILLWMAVLIAVRDLLVMGLRIHAAAQGISIAASQLGKLKSLALYPALVLILLRLPGSVALLAVATGLALVSGIDYVKAAWPQLSQELRGPRH